MGTGPHKTSGAVYVDRPPFKYTHFRGTAPRKSDVLIEDQEELSRVVEEEVSRIEEGGSRCLGCGLEASYRILGLHWKAS